MSTTLTKTERTQKHVAPNKLAITKQAFNNNTAGKRVFRTFRKSIALIALVVLWELGGRSFLGLTTPKASEVLQTGWALLQSGEIWPHVWASSQRVGIGLGIGISIGLAFGILAGLSRIAEDVLNPPLQVMRMLPTLSLVPIFIIWFGVGEEFKIALIAISPIFVIYLNTFAGIRSVDGKLIEVAGSIGLSKRALLSKIILPGALPQIFIGLRQALGIGWMALVVAELQTTSQGLGFIMNDAKEYLRTDLIFVVLVIYALLGLVTDSLVRLLEHRFLAWRNSFKGN